MVEFWISAVILAVLIALSGFFSGLEVALVGVSRSKVAQLLKDGKKGSKALHKLKTNPSWMMSSVNLGNNLVNVGASALATSTAIQFFGDNGLGIAIGIMTFLILVFGEITPKTYCNANSAKIALRYAPVLLVFSYVFYPVVKFFEIITKGVVKITGSSYLPPPITEEEIKGVIEQGLAEKALEKDEMELVHGALKFDDTVIRSVMTPGTKDVRDFADIMGFNFTDTNMIHIHANMTVSIGDTVQMMYSDDQTGIVIPENHLLMQSMLFGKSYKEAFSHTESIFHMAEKKQKLEEHFAKKD